MHLPKRCSTSLFVDPESGTGCVFSLSLAFVMIDIVPYNVATGNGARLKSLLANARRPAMRGRADALRLEEAILAEFAARRLVRLMQEGGPWWEPHDPDFPHFHAYADAQGKDRVATTLKRTTHKAMTRRSIRWRSCA